MGRANLVPDARPSTDTHIGCVRVLRVLFVLLAASCSIPNPLGFSDDSPKNQCNSNPWSCRDGEVCWPSDEQGNYDCFPISETKAGTKWAPCRNVIGEPTCGEKMACLKTKELKGGYCMPYCDDAHPCDEGERCREFRLVSPVQPAFRVCVPYNISRVHKQSGND